MPNPPDTDRTDPPSISRPNQRPKGLVALARHTANRAGGTVRCEQAMVQKSGPGRARRTRNG
jgi:hypothetical protein